MINKQTPCMTYTYIVRGPVLVIDLVFDEGTRGRSIKLCDDCYDDPGVVT